MIFIINKNRYLFLILKMFATNLNLYHNLYLRAVKTFKSFNNLRGFHNLRGFPEPQRFHLPNKILLFVSSFPSFS